MATLADRLPPSLRGLLRQKRFSAIAIASLAIAIALNTTTYSVTDALLFPHVAMRSPENLYRMPFYGDYKGRVPPEVKLEAIRGLSFFEDIAMALPNYGNGASNLAERGNEERTAQVLNVSTNYFALLGVSPLAGRLLNEADENSPTRPVVVSERFYKRMFPERTAFDTGTFTLDEDPRLVIGTLAYESDFPGRYTDVWQLPAGNAKRWQSGVFVFHVVRLKAGLSIDDAYRELGPVALRLGQLSGEGPTSARFELRKLIDGPMRVGRLQLAMIYAVLMVLFVACFNLANLQVVRGLSRSRELATRAAVGATRHDLVRLLLGESGWLAGAGVVIGLLLTFWGIHLLRTALPPSFGDHQVQPQVSWRLFAFAALTGSLALGIVGLLPAIKTSRVDVNELLKAGAGTGANRRSRWQAGVLVVCQVGLALMLMVGATFLIRQAATLHLLDINPELAKIVRGWVGVTPTGATDLRTLRDVSNQLVARAEAIEGVQVAATSRSQEPLHRTISLAQEGTLAREVATGMYQYSTVSSEFLRVYGTKVRRGRSFGPGETDRSVIVDAQTARYFWPDENPVGKQMKFGSESRRDGGGWFTVVGVADYVNLWGTFRDNQAERTAASLGAIWVLNSIDTMRVFRGLTGQGGMRRTSLDVLARTGGSVERMPMLIRRGLTDLSAGLQIGYASPLYSALQLDAAQARQDFLAGLFTAFAMIALALSSLGVYAVVSHTVSQRTREIGVRVALGATEVDIRQSVLYHGNVMALGGIAVGLFVKAYLEGALDLRSLSGDKWDVVLFAIACLVLFIATLAASYVPARRAMRINPVEALRAE